MEMPAVLVIILVALAMVIAVSQILLWRRLSSPAVTVAAVHTQLDLLNQSIQQTDRGIRDEFLGCGRKFLFIARLLGLM